MQKKLNPAWVQVVRDNVDICPYFTLMSMNIDSLEWGASRLAVDLGEKHMQPFGLVHGGVHAGLLDATAFWAIYPQLDPSEGLTTTELKINYLAPIKNGRLVGHGSTIKVGRRLCLAEARLVDGDNRLVAHGTVGLMRIPDSPRFGDMSLPPRYLD